MSKDESSNRGLFQQLAYWFKRRDWLFWAAFIPIVFPKMLIFHFSASQYLNFGFHPYFGMNFEIVEAFTDFSYYYMNFVRALVQGHLPYTETLYTIEGLQTYIYPPLFVYILGVFYYIPSELLFPDIQVTAIILTRDLDFLRVGFAFIVFDLATCIIMYAAAKQLTKNRFIPIVVMIMFAFNPISLWWGNYLWLSTPIHTFFLVLGFYFMIRGNLRWAIVWISMATMVKQTAALLIPLIWFLEYRQGFKQLFISIGITACVGILISLPYLILYPLTYIESITRGIGAYWFYDVIPQPTHPIPVSILAFYWPEPFKFIIFNLVFHGIPWMIGLIFFWIISNLIPEQPRSAYLEQLLLIALLLSLVAHIFLPRGIYKFYLIALLPFLILFGAILCGPVIPFRDRKNLIQSRGAKPIANLPSRMGNIINRFQIHAMNIVNNITTWWFVLVGLASIGISVVHRYHTHVILLALFLILLIYGSYQYVWKRKITKKGGGTNSSNEKSGTN